MPKFVENDVGKIVVFWLFFLRPGGQKIAVFQKGQTLKIKRKPWRVGQKSTFAWVAFGQKVVARMSKFVINFGSDFLRRKSKNQQEIDEEWKSTKNRLPRPIFVNFGWIWGPFGGHFGASGEHVGTFLGLHG